MTIQEFKNIAVNRLKTSGSPSAQLDVSVLLEHALNYSKTELLLHQKENLENGKEKWLNEALSKREKGLPVAYITGHKEFYGYDFTVTPDVLIPKPDTEILVERAIELVLEKMEARPDKILTICDMCTGSGCIGLSVLAVLRDEYNIPPVQMPKMTMVDISQAALKICRLNGERIFCGLTNNNKTDFSSCLHYKLSNLFEEVPGQFDLILTNPPYIPHSMVKELLKDGRNEPQLALDGDVALNGERAVNPENGETVDDGLEIIRNLIPQAKMHLAPYGMILMETGEYNAKPAALLGETAGFKSIIHKDLEGDLRVVELY